MHSPTKVGGQTAPLALSSSPDGILPSSGLVFESYAVKRFSTLDLIAGLLVTTILLGPLTAGMLASRYASNETKAKSQAPVNPAQESKR